jgi:type II secretory ATPase GspE/PulE/Tfp pilus assembly ATPase PilB-like protein
LDTVSAVPRLIDMGIEPFLLSSTVTMVVAQRLVRRICTGCRQSVEIDDVSSALLADRPEWAHVAASLQARGILRNGSDALSGMRLFRGRGCPACGGSGFRGRTGVFEILEITDEMRRMILTRPDANSLAAAGMRNKMRTMFEDGMVKVLLGETTLEELIRVAA